MMGFFSLHQNKILRGLLCALLAFVMLVSFLSCSEKQVPPKEILSAMLKGSEPLPSGSVYLTESSVGAPDHLSEELLKVLFGEEKCPDALKRLNGAAMRLSLGLNVSEFAVFHCKSLSDARSVAALCHKRIDIIKHFVNANGGALSLSGGSEALNGASVEIYGNYVLMAVCKNGARSVDLGKSALK